jgi:5,5'-dehydrodivanillate O-demethylase
MITQETNDRLTHVGPGTPMGELLRRYWHVVGFIGELDEDPVRPIRLLGEDLVLFRNAPTPTPPPSLGEGPGERAEYGLIGPRCAHRGLSMAYGIPRPNGLRCAYHGWTYDSQGHVVDMPFEPACLPLKIPAYRVQELGGVIFAYLGPEPAPLLPRYDLYARDDLERRVEITHLPCNWLQCMDNSLDPVHFEHLHALFGNYVMKKLGQPPAMHPARHIKIEFDLFEHGIYKRRLLEGEPEDCDDWRVGHPILFPNILAVGNAREPSFQIRVPVDDTHTIQYRLLGRPTKDGGPARKEVEIIRLPLFEADGRIIADTVPKQDMMAWVEQGPISDRTKEHLVTSDKGVALYHNLLLEQIELVERGEDPMAVVRDPARNEPWIDIAREQRPRQAFSLERGNGSGGRELSSPTAVGEVG